MDKREQILEVATRLFSERGFEKTSVSAICEAAKVSNGLVFHHFKNKNELLREIFKKTTNIIVEINDSVQKEISPKERLIELIDGAFKQMVEDKLFFQLYLNVMLQPTTKAILNDLIKEKYTFLLDNAHKILSEYSEHATIVDSFMFVSDLDGIAINYIYSFDDYPLDLVKQKFIRRYTYDLGDIHQKI
ncbi:MULTISPECIES: TetR/AcrR family transcriptional regulator [unclassified Tenacibaculum]|uniref:TetR/AcrR family transcriptional regulator n=1 Tax=unclassified Tenacibaculum TaxID=2635139 RepID=UPI001F268943|nr:MULTISPECIES: TetR/AcrR family transcriptional regulator [unclassified Tenacibaculum]MCF2875224.1 TetR/AcrR family transcriptional regulator [Tenacibaculum sp. Cn5-1]MCF2935300.1 TetR/AcrR family transcriptional regulator [Tenacibaculum sp. Cn5-34]MCG7511258.1 TetR/AcrR family transcriptional regulator [Tenacibaculum sp. Cn5-46]